MIGYILLGLFVAVTIVDISAIVIDIKKNKEKGE